METWGDEFNTANGNAPDPTKWVYDLGSADGWGNDELQTYTNRLDNAVIDNGNLVITAKKETLIGADMIQREYTSARIKTQGTFSQTFGKFEARMKFPSGQGIWPAF